MAFEDAAIQSCEVKETKEITLNGQCKHTSRTTIVIPEKTCMINRNLTSNTNLVLAGNPGTYEED